MQFLVQIIFAVVWIVGLTLLVVGIWYGFSFLVLAAASRLFPLTGRRRRSRDDSPIV
jgi:hypothetical protein